MDIEKLKETLAANGIDEETIAKIIADLEDKTSEDDDKGDEDKPEEGKDGKSEDDVPPADEVPPSEDDVPPVDDVVVEVPGEVPPTEVPPTEVPPEGDVPPTDIPPVDEVPPTEVPPADVPPTELPPEVLAAIDELKNENAEIKKANEGLLARVDSLEEALRNAGVLSASEDGVAIGDDSARIPPSASESVDDAFDDVLGDINRRSRKF